jgi:hypothetical protein
VKVYFELDAEDWHGHSSESLWAERIPNSQSKSVFRLLNSPFFTRGISYLDIVRAESIPGTAGFQFAEVLDRSGHSTFMILVPPLSTEFDRHWEKLEELGCGYESMTITLSFGVRTLYGVDVPESSGIDVVSSILDEGERTNVWMYQTGHLCQSGN